MRADTPSGAFTSAVMGNDHACGIATDHTIACWGSNEFGQTDAPAGAYEHLAAGFDHTCAFATDGEIDCWGNGGQGQTCAPSGTFQSLVAETDQTCAIADDDTIDCWGLTVSSRIDAPSGTYRALSAGSAHTLRHCDRRHHHLLGRQHGRPGRRADGHVPERQPGRRPLLRCDRARGSRLLGQQRIWKVGRGRRSVPQHQRRRQSHLRHRH